ncbi:rRNA methylase [Bacillus sp. V3-13]|nr:rRNA methylase [Bacillus sp. V3-13]
MQGSDKHKHTFGGSTWNTPVCPNCNTRLHQIFEFDLRDDRLLELKSKTLGKLPLISCLNCSSYWEPQEFRIDPIDKSLSIIKQLDEQHWIAEEQDRLEFPLPFSEMKLVDLKSIDCPSDEDSDAAFAVFGTEYVCRILGSPLYSTQTIVKTCSHCNRKMEYIATICSEDYDSQGLVHEGFSFNFGESFIYFYLCKSCNILATEMQST